VLGCALCLRELPLPSPPAPPALRSPGRMCVIPQGDGLSGGEGEGESEGPNNPNNEGGEGEPRRPANAVAEVAALDLSSDNDNYNFTDTSDDDAVSPADDTAARGDPANGQAWQDFSQPRLPRACDGGHPAFAPRARGRSREGVHAPGRLGEGEGEGEGEGSDSSGLEVCGCGCVCVSVCVSLRVVYCA
jgi:hypothetical protein